MKRFIIPAATGIALVASAGLAAAQSSGGQERPGMGRPEGGSEGGSKADPRAAAVIAVSLTGGLG